ncbi:MAG: arsenate reductase ArsC [Bacteroidia bacterium]|nr:arsenate reductase ArsC [Bacteroidia bacterium]NNM15731.1 arsenate reductase ArsC [Bacteroidia bacterium]
MKRVLFVCVENSNRSQMAEAFAKMHFSNSFDSYSAGSKASGVINPKAIQAMKELGYDLHSHSSVAVDHLPDVEFDFVVGMGCGDECPYVPAKQRIEWDIPDPKHMEPEDFNQIRDLIERRVKELLSANLSN